MNRIGRRVCAAVNPVSTAAARWWCHSAVRHMLTGYGPTAKQRRFIGCGTGGAGFTPSAEQMKARAEAIDGLLGRDDHECEPDPFHPLPTPVAFWVGESVLPVMRCELRMSSG
jgi:hypothetical protein